MQPIKPFTAKEAFTLVEVIVVIGIISILAVIAVSGFQYYVRKAYNVTVSHDLKSFATAEEAYFAVWNRYMGKAGDYVKGGNPPVGTLDITELKFHPSEGVTIEIISGDEDGRGDPFIARADHEKATKKYVYDFSTSRLTEEDK